MSTGTTQTRGKRSSQASQPTTPAAAASVAQENKQATPVSTGNGPDDFGFNPGNQMMVDISEDGNVFIDPQLNNRFDPEDPAEYERGIAELAATIETTKGLLQPIVVYTTPEERRGIEHDKPYELGSGYRRSDALKKLAEDTGSDHWVKYVPATVREHLPLSQRRINQLIENLARKDLTPMEIANSFNDILKDANGGITQKQLAVMTGWPTSTISNYLSILSLSNKVQDLVQKNLLPWSSAKEIVAKKLPADQQEKAAEVGCHMMVAEFKKHLDSTYGTSDAKTDEAAPAGDAAAGTVAASQKSVAKAKRSEELAKKYLPHLEEEAKKAERKDKAIWDARLDAVKFVLNQEGTKMAADLAEWEAELAKKAEEEKAGAEEKRVRDKYMSQLISLIRAKLSEVPPVDVNNPGKPRPMATLEEALQIVKLSVERDLKRGSEEGQPEHTMIQGFKVPNVDEFLKEVAAEYAEWVKTNAEARAKAAETKAKKKAEEEAKAKAEAEGKTEASEDAPAVAEAAAI